MIEQPELEFDWPEGSYERYRKFFGKTVRCWVPVEFWTDDWHRGMRWRVYVGEVCSHFGPGGQVCLQPAHHSQAGQFIAMGQCFPLRKDMKLEIIPGKARDY